MLDKHNTYVVILCIISLSFLNICCCNQRSKFQRFFGGCFFCIFPEMESNREWLVKRPSKPRLKPRFQRSIANIYRIHQIFFAASTRLNKPSSWYHFDGDFFALTCQKSIFCTKIHTEASVDL